MDLTDQLSVVNAIPSISNLTTPNNAGRSFVLFDDIQVVSTADTAPGETPLDDDELQQMDRHDEIMKRRKSGGYGPYGTDPLDPRWNNPLFRWQQAPEELQKTQTFMKDNPNSVQTIKNKDDLTRRFKPGDYLKFVILAPNPNHPNGQLRVHKMTVGDRTAHIGLAEPVGSPVFSAGWIKVGKGNRIEFDTESKHYKTIGSKIASDRAATIFRGLGFVPQPWYQIPGKPR